MNRITLTIHLTNADPLTMDAEVDGEQGLRDLATRIFREGCNWVKNGIWTAYSPLRIDRIECPVNVGPLQPPTQGLNYVMKKD